LDYIDFDIDILVWKDFSFEILDLEEFDENKKKFKYPAKIINNIQKSVSEIKFLIKKRHFPFDVKDFQLNKLPY
jgi:protein associated with RNAse G/E